MSVNKKHIATFMLGAAAAFAAYKYMKMTPEEKEKMADNLKDKAHKLKDEAEATLEKGKDYFDELKTKGSEAFKEHFGDMGDMFHNLFGGKAKTS
jgi:hypothetical protein